MDHPRPSFLLSMQGHFSVILVRPERAENIGMAARAMTNCGFHDLRLAGIEKLEEKTWITAVHAHEILQEVRFFPDAAAATRDLDLTFAASGKSRKNFTSMSFSSAVEKMTSYHSDIRIGLLFGNERTGLTSRELRSSNFRFWIPQASPQPSYNLAGAVLLTLFALAVRGECLPSGTWEPRPLNREDQEDCIQRILIGLTERGFIHETNRRHMTERIYDLLGRMAITARDRKLLMALFSKGAGVEPESKESVSG